MSGVNPQGVPGRRLQAALSEELDHDFLWRISKALPERGRIGIFNRSHYEEVVAVRCTPSGSRRQRLPGTAIRTSASGKQRYEDINAFERHLDRNGTRIVKFFLHVSKEEQKKRFLERLDRPGERVEVQRRRRRRAGALGRLHGGLRGRADGHVEPSGRPGTWFPPITSGLRACSWRRCPRRHDPGPRSPLARGLRGGASGQRGGSSSTGGRNLRRVLSIQRVWVASPMTRYWRSQRSLYVTGPRGPGTLSTLIPVSGEPVSAKPSVNRVVACQNAAVPR